jgi:hypothetical protein
LETRGIDLLNASGMASPNNRTISMMKERHKNREGLYQDDEGKNIDYKDRLSD